MIHQRIPLNDHNPDACLETYFLDYLSAYRYDNNAPVVVICPGGGFAYLADREMEPVAMTFNAMGFHAAILRYSCGKHCDVVASVADAACAVAILRQRAADFRIDPERIILCGFSAGGFVASALGVFWDTTWLCKEMKQRGREWIGWTQESRFWRPDRLILGYPVINLTEIADTLPYIENFSMANPNVCGDDYTFFRDGQKYINFRRLENTWLFGNAWPDKRTVAKYCPDMHVDAQTPPAFIWHTMQDNLVFPENSIRFAQALREAGVDCELHLFSEGFHGLSLANEVSALREGDVIPSCQMWIQLAQNWIQG